MYYLQRKKRKHHPHPHQHFQWSEHASITEGPLTSGKQSASFNKVSKQSKKIENKTLSSRSTGFDIHKHVGLHAVPQKSSIYLGKKLILMSDPIGQPEEKQHKK